jgi:hypothetical protein
VILALLLVASAIPLGPAPAAVRHECAQRADYSSYRTSCPTRWPVRRGSATVLDAAVVRGPSQWMASFDDPAFGPPDGGHVIIGGQRPEFSLAGDVGETWPRPGQPAPLPLLWLPHLVITPNGTPGGYVAQVPPKIFERATVRGQPALVLTQAPYSKGGGMNGGHVIVLFNVEGHGAFVSLHLGGYTQAQRIAAALAVASSWR